MRNYVAINYSMQR